MANQQLLDQLYQLLSQSKSFQLLEPVEQSEVKTSFTTVGNEQLQQAINELKADIASTAKKEAEARKNAELAAEQAEQLKEEIKTIEKETLKEDQMKDENESKKSADDLLSDLTKKEEPIKRKKWFGLF